MPALYNENEPYAADWLVNLERAGHIAAGRVDRRSISELQPGDLDGVTQAHFFAGLGGWSHALRLASWPDDVGVWTGSCPCQPFSAAGRKGGFDDARHLWPEWFRLIRECRPPVVFGEQVASPDGLRWLDTVSADLEGLGYAFGAADLCAGGVGAPHIRQRLYFVAHAGGERLDGLGLRLRERRPLASMPEAAGCGEVDGVAHGDKCGRHQIIEDLRARQPDDARRGTIGETRILGDPYKPRPQGRRVGRIGADQRTPRASGLADFWADVEWLDCLDGKRRPTKPGLHPLAHGVPARVRKLRAGGNAIVPQVAATFIRAAVKAWLTI